MPKRGKSLPGERSSHVQDIWGAMQARGVEGISVDLRTDTGVKQLRLTENLLHEFIRLMRGNNVDQKIGPWLGGFREILKIRDEAEQK